MDEVRPEEKRKKQLKIFYIHFAVFLVVNVSIITANFLLERKIIAFFIIALIWSIAMAMHSFYVFSGSDSKGVSLVDKHLKIKKRKRK